MEQIGLGEQAKFSNPAEELKYLREQVAAKEKLLLGKPEMVPHEQAALEELQNYREFKPHEVLTPEYALKPSQVEQITLELSPELHDDQMSELLAILQTKGG